MVEISVLKGEGVTTIQQQKTRVSQKLVFWTHASKLSRSALMKRSLYTTTRSSPCARSQKTELGDSAMEFRPVHTWGTQPCPEHKQGKLRVTAQSLPGVPHREQNIPEHPQGEHQTRPLTGNISHLYTKALLSNQRVTRQGLKSLFNGISLQKNSFTWCPWYSLLHNNLVIACPTATRAHECAGKQLAQVRENSIWKLELILCIWLHVLATSER